MRRCSFLPGGALSSKRNVRERPRHRGRRPEAEADLESARCIENDDDVDLRSIRARFKKKEAESASCARRKPTSRSDRRLSARTSSRQRVVAEAYGKMSILPRRGANEGRTRRSSSSSRCPSSGRPTPLTNQSLVRTAVSIGSLQETTCEPRAGVRFCMSFRGLICVWACFAAVSARSGARLGWPKAIPIPS